MNTAKKITLNRLTTKRTKKDLKRRKYVKALKLAQKKLNLITKRNERLEWFSSKMRKNHLHPTKRPTTPII